MSVTLSPTLDHELLKGRLYASVLSSALLPDLEWSLVQSRLTTNIDYKNVQKFLTCSMLSSQEKVWGKEKESWIKNIQMEAF
jgi:hypothetical protein